MSPSAFLSAAQCREELREDPATLEGPGSASEASPPLRRFIAVPIYPVRQSIFGSRKRTNTKQQRQERRQPEGEFASIGRSPVLKNASFSVVMDGTEVVDWTRQPSCGASASAARQAAISDSNSVSSLTATGWLSQLKLDRQRSGLTAFPVTLSGILPGTSCRSGSEPSKRGERQAAASELALPFPVETWLADFRTALRYFIT